MKKTKFLKRILASMMVAALISTAVVPSFAEEVDPVPTQTVEESETETDETVEETTESETEEMSSEESTDEPETESTSEEETTEEVETESETEETIEDVSFEVSELSEDISSEAVSVINGETQTIVKAMDISVPEDTEFPVTLKISCDGVSDMEDVYLLHRIKVDDDNYDWETIYPDAIYDNIIEATFTSLSPVVVVRSLTEEEMTPVKPEYEYEYAEQTAIVSGVIITVKGDIPVGGSISVSKIDKDLLQTYVDQDELVTSAFDITIYDADGNKYEPCDYDKTIDVTFTGLDKFGGDEYKVVHLKDNEKYEVLATTDESSVTVSTDSFSIYGTTTLTATGTMTVEGNVNIPLVNKNGAIYHMYLSAKGEEREAFCLDLGKAASSGDKYTYSGSYTENADVRKVVTLYYATNNGTDYTLTYTEAQALVWAAQAGYTSEDNFKEVLTSVGTTAVMQNNIITAYNAISTPDNISLWINTLGGPSDGYQRFITDIEVQTLTMSLPRDPSANNALNVRIFKKFENYTDGNVYIRVAERNSIDFYNIFPTSVDSNGTYQFDLSSIPELGGTLNDATIRLFVEDTYVHFYFGKSLATGYFDPTTFTNSYSESDSIFNVQSYSGSLQRPSLNIKNHTWDTSGEIDSAYKKALVSGSNSINMVAFYSPIEVYNLDGTHVGNLKPNYGSDVNIYNARGYFHNWDSSALSSKDVNSGISRKWLMYDLNNNYVNLSKTKDLSTPVATPIDECDVPPVRYLGYTNVTEDVINLFNTSQAVRSLNSITEGYPAITGTNRLSEGTKVYLAERKDKTYNDNYVNIRLIYNNTNWTGQNVYLSDDETGTHKVYPAKMDGYGVYSFKVQDILNAGVTFKYIFVNGTNIGGYVYQFTDTTYSGDQRLNVVPATMTDAMTTSVWYTDPNTTTNGTIKRTRINLANNAGSAYEYGFNCVAFIAPLRIYSEDGSQFLEEHIDSGWASAPSYSRQEDFRWNINTGYRNSYDSSSDVIFKYYPKYAGFRDNLSNYDGTTHAPSFERNRQNGIMMNLAGASAYRLSQGKNIYLYRKYRTLILDKGNADTGSNINVYYGSAFEGYRNSGVPVTDPASGVREVTLRGEHGSDFGYYYTEGADSLDNLYFRESPEHNVYAQLKYNTHNPMSDVNFESVMPTKAGYILKGYYTAPNGGGEKVLDVKYTSTNKPYLTQVGYDFKASGSQYGYTVSGTKFTIAGDTKTLYAYFEEHTTKKVTYVDTFKTGGTEPTDTTEYEINDTVTVKGRNTLVRTGWTFVGWTPVNAHYVHGTSTLYAPNDTFNITDNTTLYAVWKKTLPIVTVDYRGATVRPTREKYAVNTDTPDRLITSIGGKDVSAAGGNVVYSFSDINTVNATEFALAKPHYVYGGIYTQTNGAGTQVVSNVPAYNETYIATVNSDRTVYAKWTPVQYTVSFVTNGGSAVPDKTVDYDTKIGEPITTKPGNVFKGWFRDPGFTTQWNFSTDTVTDNITLYAKWEATKYTVIFKNLDGSEIDRISNLEYGNTFTATATVPEYHGYKGKYTFIGKWGIKNGLAITIGTGTLVHNKVEVLTGSTAYVDAWNRMINDATIVFYPCYETSVKYRYIWYDDDGITKLKNVAKDSYSASDVTTLRPTNPTKAGYTFNGWITVKSLADAYNEWLAEGEDPTEEIVVKFKASYKKDIPKTVVDPDPTPDPDPEPKPDPDPTPTPPIEPTPTPGPVKPTKPVKPTPEPEDPPVIDEDPTVPDKPDPIVDETEEIKIYNPEEPVPVEPESPKPKVMRTVVGALIAGAVAVALVATGALDYIWMLALLLLARKKRIKFHGILTDLDNRFITFDGVDGDSNELVQDIINKHDKLEDFVEDIMGAKETTWLPPYTKMTISYTGSEGVVSETMDANEEKLWQELAKATDKVIVNIHNSKAKFELEFDADFS